MKWALAEPFFFYFFFLHYSSRFMLQYNMQRTAYYISSLPLHICTEEVPASPRSTEWILVNLRFRAGSCPLPRRTADGLSCFVSPSANWNYNLKPLGNANPLLPESDVIRCDSLHSGQRSSSSMPKPAVDYYRNVLFKTCAGFWTASAHPCVNEADSELW